MASIRQPDIKTITIYSFSEIEQVDWPDTDYGHFAKQYLIPLMQENILDYINNISVPVKLLKLRAHIIPIVFTDRNFPDSYVCSNYNQYITYAKEECYHVQSRYLRTFLSFCISGLSFLGKFSKINKVIYVNNWLFSTNLYQTLNDTDIADITKFLIHQFPKHTICFRSVNQTTSAWLYYSLKKRFYSFIASRQVYIFPEKSEGVLTKSEQRVLKKDANIFENSGYEILKKEALDLADLTRIKDLYDQLYLQKYSKNNPQYTKLFFQNLCDTPGFELIALKKNGRIDAVLGYFKIEGILSTPIFGYDISLPQSIGLYRMLNSLTLAEAKRNNLRDHASAGAAEFKRNRGYQPTMEYTGVYFRHLPLRQQLLWRLLAWISRVIVEPLLIKMKV